MQPYKWIRCIFAWLSIAWCRVIYGHVMVPIGSCAPQTVMYMCARCLLCQNLAKMGTEDGR